MSDKVFDERKPVEATSFTNRTEPIELPRNNTDLESGLKTEESVLFDYGDQICLEESISEVDNDGDDGKDQQAQDKSEKGKKKKFTCRVRVGTGNGITEIDQMRFSLSPIDQTSFEDLSDEQEESEMESGILDKKSINSILASNDSVLGDSVGLSESYSSISEYLKNLKQKRLSNNTNQNNQNDNLTTTRECISNRKNTTVRLSMPIDGHINHNLSQQMIGTFGNNGESAESNS